MTGLKALAGWRCLCYYDSSQRGLFSITDVLGFPTHNRDVHARSQKDMWKIKLTLDWNYARECKFGGGSRKKSSSFATRLCLVTILQFCITQYIVLILNLFGFTERGPIADGVPDSVAH